MYVYIHCEILYYLQTNHELEVPAASRWPCRRPHYVFQTAGRARNYLLSEFALRLLQRFRLPQGWWIIFSAIFFILFFWSGGDDRVPGMLYLYNSFFLYLVRCNVIRNLLTMMPFLRFYGFDTTFFSNLIDVRCWTYNNWSRLILNIKRYNFKAI